MTEPFRFDFDDSHPRQPSTGGFWHYLGWLRNTWLIGTFLVAVIHLLIFEQLRRDSLMATLLPPLCTAYFAGSKIVSTTGRVLARGFLLLLALGIELSFVPGLLPCVKGFRHLPPQQGRILTWYGLLFLNYVAIVPPGVYGIRGIVQWYKNEECFPPLEQCLLGLAAAIFVGPFLLGKTLGIFGLW